MLSADKLIKVLAEEIKYNVKVCKVSPTWLKDKQVITIDHSGKLVDIHPTGFARLDQIRRSKDIKYMLIRNGITLYVADTCDGRSVEAMRSHQDTAWCDLNDINNVGDSWWIKHLNHYTQKHSRFMSSIQVAEQAKFELEYWLERGKGTVHFTTEIEYEINYRLRNIEKAITALKEKEDEIGQSLSGQPSTMS